MTDSTLPVDLVPAAPPEPASTRAVLVAALGAPRARERYAAKVHQQHPDACWFWIGALHSRRGHGRFWLGSYTDAHGRQRDCCVIAHRFGWGLVHGTDALLDTPVLAHTCDEPSCQNPEHLQASTITANRDEWLRRRWQPRSPLRDTRGPAGRAHAIRHAILNGHNLSDAMALGLREVDRAQLELPLG